MGYITNADIEARVGSAAYVQLADDDGDGQADAGVVDEVRRGAEGEVNGYLARRFQTPIDLTAHPELADVLASITLDVAEYRLRARRPPIPPDAVRRREETVGWLGGVAAGSIDLPAATPLAASAARGTVAKASGAPRLLTRDELSGH